jgi:Flp pilus assembly protein TadD
MHAVRLAPDNPDSMMALGIALTHLGRIPEAFKIMERARRAFPVTTSYFQHHYAVTRWAAGDYAGAVTAADQCLMHAPELVLCWVDRIVALADAGRTDEAIASAKTMRVLCTQADHMHFSRGFINEQPMLKRRLAAATLVGIAN